MKYTRCIILCFAVIVTLRGTSGLAEIQMEGVPVWSALAGLQSSGVGWGDFDQDGWLDLIASTGIDTLPYPCFIYYNSNGQLYSSSGWYSLEYGFWSHLYIGDFNCDHYPDLAASRLGNFNPGFSQTAQVAFFSASDTLARIAGWHSQPCFSWSCNGGDPDGDGDMDIVFAAGFDSLQCYERPALYENEWGTFDSFPVWETDSTYIAYDVKFSDVDMDGDLDLGMTGPGLGLAVFYNRDAVLETYPTWETQSIYGGSRMAFGDYDGDGDPDLAVAGRGDGTGFTGAFYLFENMGDSLSDNPVWSCSTYVEPSAVEWGDADADGDLDLAACTLGSYVGIFENLHGTLSDNFVWSWSIEAHFRDVAWGDFEGDGIINAVETFIGDGETSLYYLPHLPLHQFGNILIDGNPLPLWEYCYDMTTGWISLESAPDAGAVIEIDYSYSLDLDLACTCEPGVFVFRNFTDPNCVESLDNAVMITMPSLNQNVPNPFNPTTVLNYELLKPGRITLSVYNIEGEAVANLVDSFQTSGEHYATFNGSSLSSGVYFARLITGNHQIIRKMLLLK